MEYIATARDELEEDGGCVFCAVPTREPERVLARGELAYIVLNKFPYNPGHLLIVPLRHTGDAGGSHGRGERRAAIAAAAVGPSAARGIGTPWVQRRA